MPALPAAQYDRRINHIMGPSCTAKLACFARHSIRQWLDSDFDRTQQAGQACLTPAILPRLTDHAGRHGKRATEFQSALQQGDHLTVVALECDERSSIKGEPTHLACRFRGGCFRTPNARSAARRSAAVNGPPDSASISSKS